MDRAYGSFVFTLAIWSRLAVTHINLPAGRGMRPAYRTPLPPSLPGESAAVGTTSLRGLLNFSRSTLIEVKGTLVHLAGKKRVASGAPSQPCGAGETQRCRRRVASTRGVSRSR